MSENENHSQVCLTSGGSRYCLDFIEFFWPKNFNDFKVLAVRRRPQKTLLSRSSGIFVALFLPQSIGVFGENVVTFITDGGPLKSLLSRSSGIFVALFLPQSIGVFAEKCPQFLKVFHWF